MAAMLLYAVVGNIPRSYHSSDLRNFFSRFLETDGFDCFHFRHRPETKETERKQGSSLEYTQNTQETHGSSKNANLPATCCCVIRLSETHCKDLIQVYNGRHWITEKGESMRSACRISKIKLSSKSKDDNIEPQYKTRLEQSLVSADREEFYEEDLKNLVELHPPTVMPKGNVGTPTLVFLDLIRQCLLPPKIISKLKLKFPKTAISKRYGNVPFDYDGSGNDQEDVSVFWLPVTSGLGHELQMTEEAAEDEGSNGTVRSLDKEKGDIRDENVRVVMENSNVGAKQGILDSVTASDSDQTVDDKGVEERVKRILEDRQIKESGEIEEEGESDCEEGDEERKELDEEKSRDSSSHQKEKIKEVGVEREERRNQWEERELEKEGRDKEMEDIEREDGSQEGEKEGVKRKETEDTEREDGSQEREKEGLKRKETEYTEREDGSQEREKEGVKGKETEYIESEDRSQEREKEGVKRKETEDIEREDGSQEGEKEWMRRKETECKERGWAKNDKNDKNRSLFKERIRLAKPNLAIREENIKMLNKEKMDEETIKKKKIDFEKQKVKEKRKEEMSIRRKKMALRIEEKMIEFERGSDHSEDDVDECEEWERHEALHDDPSNQERNEERLFENEIELKWEKGGSGLVFYTDAQFWKQQDGDFDEQTADDWDVDMSGYYEPGSGDMDGRDLIQIRRDQRRRDGLEDEDGSIAGIGKFEKHTKGFGRKIMERQGWKDGEGLGSSALGIAEALTNDGQNPRCKTGFGFQESKRGKRSHTFNKRQEIQEWHGPIISTVYDEPSVTDPVDPLLRRNEPYQLKRRKIDEDS